MPLLQQARSYLGITLGFIVLFAGIVMLALPGPGWVTLGIGIILLAGHFVWARRLLRMIKRFPKPSLSPQRAD